MAEEAAEIYGYHVNPKFHKIFTEYHKTHNQAVFDAYTPEMKTARHCHIVTGLPDTYGRGRIVGDYRRIALYGIDFLIQEKKKDLERCGNGAMFDDIIRQREEIAEQIRALKGIQEMAAIYGLISPVRLPMPKKPSSGSTSVTSLPLRPRTVPP